MKKYSNIYKSELLEHVIPFWEKYSIDPEGGYFTCLTTQGEVFDEDKFMWLQGRQVWMFSTLFNQVENRKKWKDIAIHGADFMLNNGRDEYGNWYFSLNREGKPLTQAYNIFSDCFAALGLGALYKIQPDPIYAEVAKSTFMNILERRADVKGPYNKIYPGTRDLKSFSLPMILSNLSLEMEHILEAALVEKLIDDVIHEVMEVFYQEESGLILENVNPDGTFNDSFEGRLVNPGHTLEAMWFLMDLAVRKNDQELTDQCITIALNALDYGWDKEYGGIFYFMDIKGYPPQELEWDQKLWWVHVEALVCMAKAWKLTGNPKCKAWFERIHDYAFTKFSDHENGEWYGYLNRRGEVLLELKGGKWKGCFHVPRALLQIYSTIEPTIKTNENQHKNVQTIKKAI